MSVGTDDGQILDRRLKLQRDTADSGICVKYSIGIQVPHSTSANDLRRFRHLAV